MARLGINQQSNVDLSRHSISQSQFSYNVTYTKSLSDSFAQASNVLGANAQSLTQIGHLLDNVQEWLTGVSRLVTEGKIDMLVYSIGRVSKDAATISAKVGCELSKNGSDWENLLLTQLIQHAKTTENIPKTLSQGRTQFICGRPDPFNEYLDSECQFMEQRRELIRLINEKITD